MTLDRADLAAQVHRVNIVMRGHAGGIELVDAGDDGDVSVRFTGMCCGCPYKALTWGATVEPALRSVPGVRSVAAPGVRISEESAARLQHYVDRTRDPHSVRGSDRPPEPPDPSRRTPP